MKNRPMVAVLVPILYLCACADKAKPELDKCVASEAQGKLKEALKSCRAAVEIDRDSEAGKVADSKIAPLQLAWVKSIDAEVAKKKAEDEARRVAELNAAVARTPKALADHEEMLMTVPLDWRLRVAAHIRGEKEGDACPDGAKSDGATGGGVYPCRASNEKALDLLMVCPQRLSLRIDLSKYDSSNKRFVIANEDEAAAAGLALEGRVWFPGYGYLTFPGALPAYKLNSTGLSTEMCQGGALLDKERTISQFRIALEMGDNDAAALGEKLAAAKRDYGIDANVRFEFAFLLDGGKSEDAFVCGAKPSKIAPTGRVLGWQLYVDVSPRIPLTGWIGVSGWEPPASCDEVKSLLGGKPLAAAPDAQCACSLLQRWTTSYGWIPQDTLGDCFPFTSIGDLREARRTFENGGPSFEKLAAEIDGTPGCAADKGAIQAMKATIAGVRSARKIWEATLKKESPTLTELNAALAATCKLRTKLVNTLSSNCTGASCRFGCPER